MFRRMDKNRNGSLSREEFALGLKETGLTVTNQEVAELFKVSGYSNSEVVRLSDGKVFSNLPSGRDLISN